MLRTMQTNRTESQQTSRPAAAAQLRQAYGISARVNRRGELVWCSDWAALLALALRGQLRARLNRRGQIVWVG